MSRLYRPQHLWIDRQVVDSPITANVVSQLAGVPIDVIDGPPPLAAPADQAELMTLAKKHLYLTAQKGRFVRDCPGASSRNAEGRLCCGYVIVDTVSNCNYDCTYCYLQSYVNTPYLTVYANVERLFEEVAAFLRTRPHQLVRMGSGGVQRQPVARPADRLFGPAGAVHPPVSKRAVRAEDQERPDRGVAGRGAPGAGDGVVVHQPAGRGCSARSTRRPRWRRGCERRGVAWRRVTRSACISTRCSTFPAWEDVYEPFVEQVFRAIDPRDVTTLSMGSLRFAPDLKDVVRARFPRSRLMTAELFPSEDGKIRYFRPLRADMYAKIVGLDSPLRARRAALPVHGDAKPSGSRPSATRPACSADVEQHIQTGKIPLLVS